MVLVAMLAMLLALAAPAFAQDSFVNQEADQFGVVDDSISSQVFNVAVQQYDAGNQTATADASADADTTADAFAGAHAVGVANAAGIDIHTVNVSLNNWW